MGVPIAKKDMTYDYLWSFKEKNQSIGGFDHTSVRFSLFAAVQPEKLFSPLWALSRSHYPKCVTTKNGTLPTISLGQRYQFKVLTQV